MNKNISVLSIAITLVILIRCVCDHYEKIVYIVAGINIIAIVFVLCTIIDKAVSDIVEKIKVSKVPEQIIHREIRNMQSKMWGWSIGICAIVIVLYLSCWCSSLGNDIISILALGISVLDDEIEKKITENYKISR